MGEYTYLRIHLKSTIEILKHFDCNTSMVRPLDLQLLSNLRNVSALSQGYCKLVLKFRVLFQLASPETNLTLYLLGNCSVSDSVLPTSVFGSDENAISLCARALHGTAALPICLVGSQIRRLNYARVLVEVQTC